MTPSLQILISELNSLIMDLTARKRTSSSVLERAMIDDVIASVRMLIEFFKHNKRYELHI